MNEETDNRKSKAERRLAPVSGLGAAPNRCEALPPVPQWWWDYGMEEAMRKQAREAAVFDNMISRGIKAPNEKV